MARVSKKVLVKLTALFDALPEEERYKCTLCNETLVHLVKQAEAKSGAPTATVTRELAKRVNESAAPGDRVSARALNERVRQREGLNDHKIRNPENKPQPPAPAPEPEAPIQATDQRRPKEPQQLAGVAMYFVIVAINQLEQIKKNDPMRVEALNQVKAWIDEQLLSAQTEAVG